MRTIRSIALCLALAPALTFAVAQAAEGRKADAGALYGQGVHAYFNGNSTQAEYYLSSALEQNRHDPRLYYFRGLALLRLGRGDEARGDMMAGARLEAQQPGKYAIGTALQRVQGSDRLLLEEVRRQSRSEAQAQRRRVQQARYGPASIDEDRVLRRRIIVSLDEFLPNEGPRLSAASPTTTPPPPTTPIVPVAAGNPFADDPAPVPVDADATDSSAEPILELDTSADEAPAENGADAAEEIAEEDEALFGTGEDDPFAE